MHETVCFHRSSSANSLKAHECNNTCENTQVEAQMRDPTYERTHVKAHRLKRTCKITHMKGHMSHM